VTDAGTMPERGRDVALIFQPFRAETHAAALRCVDALAALGVGCELLPAFELEGVPADRFQLALTFGGDGTALRAAAWLLRRDIPIVPIRMGKLSFLAEVDPEDAPATLSPLLAGDYWVDERAMLEATCDGQTVLALNDVVLGRGAASRAVRLDVRVDDELLAHYTSDGIIVATATGSTAYALAAGGPVLMPSLQTMLLVPIAPHLTHLRAMVVPREAQVHVVVHTVQDAVFTADGHLDLPVANGGEIIVRVASQTTRFARLGRRSAFYRSLESRLQRRE
jgi:NAD+ kinase